MKLFSCLIVSTVLLYTATVLRAQSNSTQASAESAETTVISRSELEKHFMAVIRDGDALKFLSYVPEDGLNLGRHADHATRGEIEDQLTRRTGLYCRLFDSACLTASAGDAKTACSYRELLTRSEKVRTASSEITRNGVRQAIVIAEMHNQKCGGSVLIDFIFNSQKGGWKLFSIP